MSKLKKPVYITHIKEIELKGYKSIFNLKTELNPGLNILIGKNGAGKSNFLECLEISLARYDERAILDYLKISLADNKGEIYTWSYQKTLNGTNGVTNRYSSYPEKRNIKKEFFSIGENLLFESKKDAKSYNLKDSTTIIDTEVFRPLYFILRDLNVQFEAPALVGFGLPFYKEYLETPYTIKIAIDRKENIVYNVDHSRSLHHFFSKFLSQLYKNLGNLYERKIEEITYRLVTELLTIENILKEKLKKYSPISDIRFLKNINVFSDENRLEISNLQIEFLINKNWISWSMLSDGTKRLFYLISEIACLDKGIVLVEEPELGIHPHQFHQIMEFLKEESVDKQIIISTHSPQALNALNENELSNILLTTYDEKKGTQIKHLNKAQQVKAKKYMNEVSFLSDYWMLADLEQ